MNFELNRLQNHQNRLDLMMMESEEEVSGSGGGGGGGEMEKEHMFDKVVTPSDVGKLNRLVIPKQHAERFFPLDSSTNDKGLLLNFEDRNGKSWRFRYSYWNSSQSYVMTKGWSRFVKEKRLDAGDIVSFQRGVGEIGRDRLYIDWRRRPDFPLDHHHHLHHHQPTTFLRPSVVVPAATTPWGSLVWRPLSTAAGYPHPHNNPAAAPRDHAHLSQINNNKNNMVYDWNRGCCSYGFGSVESGVVYVRRELGRRGVVAPRLRDEETMGDDQEEGNYQVQQQEYCSSDGGAAVVVHGRNYEEQLKKTTNYSEEEEEEDEEEEEGIEGTDTPVKKSRLLRLFGVNMEFPISTTSNSHHECDLLLSSSASSSNSKTTTTIPITTTATATHNFQFPPSPPSHPRDQT